MNIRLWIELKVVAQQYNKMAETIPYEILCQIFEYLPLSDRLQCSLVSKHFNYSFRNSTPKLHAKTCATFDNDDQVGMVTCVCIMSECHIFEGK